MADGITHAAHSVPLVTCADYEAAHQVLESVTIGTALANQLQIAGSATDAPVTLTADGSSTGVGIQIIGKELIDGVGQSPWLRIGNRPPIPCVIAVTTAGSGLTDVPIDILRLEILNPGRAIEINAVNLVNTDTGPGFYGQLIYAENDGAAGIAGAIVADSGMAGLVIEGVGNFGGTVEEAAGVYIGPPASDSGDGAITRLAGLQIENQAGVGTSQSYNIWSRGAASLNVFEGTLELPEITALAAPASNRCRIYVEDNGAGKTRLMARFPTGAAQVLATEP